MIERVTDEAGEFDPLGRGHVLLRTHERDGRTGGLITGKFS